MEHTLAAETAVDTNLAAVSDSLIIAMIVAYAIALFLFAVEAAYGRRRRLRANRLMPAGAAAEPAAVGAAGPAAAGGGGMADLDAEDDMEVRLRREEPEPSAAQHVVGRIAVVVTALGLLLNAGQIATRGLAADRWPWGNMFEFVVAICLCSVAAFLYAAVRYQARFLGTFVLLPVLVLLGIAARWLYSEAGPVIPALHSYWIAIHVSAAIIATGGFMVAGAGAIAYLMARRTEIRRAAGERVSGVAAKLPDSELLDRVSHRFIVLAFPLWTFAIIAGAVWADEAWGRFWGWDPKEVWSFITWVAYAAYLHARATAGWRGSKATWIGLIGFGCLLFNFFAVNYLFSGLHSYA
ncbi:c-type cytochrome biogenesis protein CcsB [Streptomonospora nanhaiensis]|uniref:Cytochrome c-type biogenesis protein CcsB n=1 Tax=Streptomonospora nanhaiensis TaxID=1323731 RepID=A0A853BP27_9ACTN|nr:c-type cytochrome biogenesis protein CcsB [Streptomonospora nanhaiensis]MBV2361785.1 c-type cytochrome biogenesis protein CcsB [Streptomonospora nanhaiensis]MBX9388003.1 c-type cytochrome biogenesis protein CcsB [Streptomonospora nanhaiensis]NYI96396.1 cytochrome c-type biogenesis protein CcsB [Streptomonospora nanhaiensis]